MNTHVAPMTQPHEIAQFVVKGIEVDMMAVESFTAPTEGTSKRNREVFFEHCVGLLTWLLQRLITGISMILMHHFRNNSINIGCSPLVFFGLPFSGLLVFMDCCFTFWGSRTGAIIGVDLFSMPITPIGSHALVATIFGTGIRPFSREGIFTAKADDFHAEMIIIWYDSRQAPPQDIVVEK
jgi:hypothetical protein